MKRSSTRAIITLGFILALPSCATLGRYVTKGKGVKTFEMEPIIIESKPQGEGMEGYRVLDAPSLFEMAGEKQEFLDCERAEKYYHLLMENYPNSPLIPPALYNSGLCFEFEERLDLAMKRYQEILDHHRRSSVFGDALFRQGLILEKKGDFRAAKKRFKKVLSLKGLSNRDRATAMIQYGIELANLKRYRRALKTLEKGEDMAMALVEKGDLISYFLAKLHITRGLIFSEHIPLVKMKGGPERLEKRLKEVGDLFASAKEEFRLALNEKVPEFMIEAIYWAGEGYEKVFATLNNAPIPKELEEEERRLYSALLRKKTSPLLIQAIDTYSHLITLGDIFGHNHPLIIKGKERIEEIESYPFLQGGE